jgi:hypothetical protein
LENENQSKNEVIDQEEEIIKANNSKIEELQMQLLRRMKL